jgi:sugar phosphate isomerase/epimerase
MEGPGIMFLRFNPPYTMKDSARIIKEVGFRSVMLWWNENAPQAGYTSPMERYNGKYEQLAILRERGIDICFLHSDPIISCNELWRKNEHGDGLVEELRATIDDCRSIEVPVMIMHVGSGRETPGPNRSGLDRMRELTEHANMRGVIIAIENSRNPGHIDFLLENISSPSLGFCYDSGHDFLYSDTPYDLLRRHGGRLAAVHLHDNEGKNQTVHRNWHPDSHAIPGEGNVDWRTVKGLLDEAEYRGVRLLEIESNTARDAEKPEEFLKRAYDSYLAKIR